MRIPDLLQAQRVSKAWQGTIKSSPKLQQALFFESVPADTTKTFFVWDIYNPQLRSLLAEPREHEGRKFSQYMRRQDIVQNPLWKVVFPRKPSPKQEAIDRPEASWRRMLLSQPATQISSFKLGEIVRIGDLRTREHAKRFFKFKWGRMEGWRQVKYASEVYDAMNDKAIALEVQRDVKTEDEGED